MTDSKPRGPLSEQERMSMLTADHRAGDFAIDLDNALVAALAEIKGDELIILALGDKLAAMTKERDEARARPVRIARPGEDLSSKQAKDVFRIIELEDHFQATAAIASEYRKALSRANYQLNQYVDYWRHGIGVSSIISDIDKALALPEPQALMRWKVMEKAIRNCALPSAHYLGCEACKQALNTLDGGK